MAVNQLDWPLALACSAAFSVMVLAVNSSLQMDAEEQKAGQYQIIEFKGLSEHVIKKAANPSVNEQVQQGKSEAAAEGIITHAECKMRFSGDRQSLNRLGCSQMVTERKPLPLVEPRGDAIAGLDARACKELVDRYWEPRHNDRVEQGDLRSAQVLRNKQWLSNLRSCPV